MQSAVDALLHDTALIYRLVDFVTRFCVDQRSGQSYPQATTVFFDNVLSLADKTKKHLITLAAEADRRSRSKKMKWLQDAWLRNQRDSILTIKGSWSIIHRYLKPAADAHALRVPIPLVELAERQLQSVVQMSGAKVAVLLTPELNYFQTSHTRLKTAITALESKITDKPRSSVLHRIGFVELPYSQGPSLFTNLALYHELGHFALEERFSTETDSDDPLAKAAQAALMEVYGNRFTRLSKDRRAGAKTWLRNWAEEVFCDLFAIRLIGPAFSFASIEMFSLIGLLAKENLVKFLPSHPAPACRFGEHLRALKQAGWWRLLKNLPTQHRSNIEEIAAIPKTEYTLYIDRNTRGDQRALHAFDLVLPVARSLADNLTEPPNDLRRIFSQQRAEISNCLANGVVPSRLLAGNKLYPAHPVAVINAAFCFYLTRLPALINRLAGLNASNVDHRSQWTQRLEAWTIKAIEDYYLLNGVPQSGRRRKNRN